MPDERATPPQADAVTAPPIPPGPPGLAGDVPLPIRVQMMATEHWSLLASRNLAWTESFTRASMFLSTLSFAVVAMALVGQATAFGEEFRVFALVLLPVVLFLGIATSLRMDSANHHDALCVIGMNRIRAGYLEIAPDLERFFVMGTTDDFDGITKTMAILPGRSTFINLVGASPTLLAVLNSVLVGAIVALVTIQIGLGMAAAVILGAVAFVISAGVWATATRHMLTSLMNEHRPMFPPAGDQSPR
ncbi:MAG TPA: hypothetical protein VLA76_04980 [Candidatus Angelobacter sp.]|nr:hypothetical protein [Candidatus Angelobacter sp.]